MRPFGETTMNRQACVLGILAIVTSCMLCACGDVPSESSAVTTTTTTSTEVRSPATNESAVSSEQTSDSSETKAEPESFDQAASPPQDEQASTDQENTSEEPTATAPTAEETAGEQLEEVDRKIVLLEDKLMLLQAKLTKKTKNLALVQRNLLHVAADINAARVAYAAGDSNSAEVENNMVKLSEYELEHACILAGIDSETLVPAK